MKYLQLTALVCLCLAAVSLTADVMPGPQTPFITSPPPTIPNTPQEHENGVWLTIDQINDIKIVIQDALKMINKQKQEIDHLKNITGCS